MTVFTIDVMWLAEYATRGYLEPIAKYVKNKDLTTEDYDVNDFVPRDLQRHRRLQRRSLHYPVRLGHGRPRVPQGLDGGQGHPVPQRFDGKWTHKAMYDAFKALQRSRQGRRRLCRDHPQKWFWGWAYTPMMYAWQRPETIGNEFVDQGLEGHDRERRESRSVEVASLLARIHAQERRQFRVWRGRLRPTSRERRLAGSTSRASSRDGSRPTALAVKGKNAYLQHRRRAPWPDGPVLRLVGHGDIDRDSKQKEAAWTLIQWATDRK